MRRTTLAPHRLAHPLPWTAGCSARLPLAAGLLAAIATVGGCQGGGGATDPPTPAPTPTSTPAADVAPLAEAARRSGHRVGAAVQSDLLSGEPLYAATFERHFDAVTAEWEMKWDVNEPEPGRFDFTRGDRILAFAEARALWVRGHTLVWHQQLPAWVGALSAGELRIAFEDHIRGVAGHYAGRVHAWDVVNEAVADGAGVGGLRDTPFLRGLGPEYAAEAFRLARQADPQARLYYKMRASPMPSHTQTTTDEPAPSRSAAGTPGRRP